MALPAIEPMPPIAPIALPWDAPVDDAVTLLADARRRCGDTFVVDSGATRYLFGFSPRGVRSFYALAEEEASKGVADWQMLLRKLPPELFDGRRTVPHDLFNRSDAARHLANLDGAIEVEFTELGDQGTLEVFEFTRRLGHRLGLASWAGAESARGERFERLVAAIDTLDGADAFVHPDEVGPIAASGYARERAALANAEVLLAETLHERRHVGHRGDLLDDLTTRWDDAPHGERDRGVARDIILVHLGSMSNLFAALGWMIVNLLQHPRVLARVRAGADDLLEGAALESTRLAQRSIMMRTVLRPTSFETEHGSHHVDRGVVIATFLPLTNTSAGPGLDRYDPDRWHRGRLAAESALPARELVATFGHGKHACPARPYALAAMTRSVRQLVDSYELTPLFDTATPLPAQIGGVARAAAPCPVHYALLGARGDSRTDPS